MRLIHAALVFAIATVATSATSLAQTPSQYQTATSAYMPSAVGQVFLAGSDSLSASFNSGYLNNYLNYIKAKLPEGKAFTGIGLNQLDPERLYFIFAYAPRVYFLYEGACYWDDLCCTIATVTAPTNRPTSGTSYTLFPMAHCSIAPVCATGSGKRSSSEPLYFGDFVQLPTVQPGQQLAFYIQANLNSQGRPANTWYNGASNNSDKFQHMVAFFPDNSQYLIIGFEDMANGGDMDCNDVMFAVDVGPNNAAVWRAPSTMPK